MHWLILAAAEYAVFRGNAAYFFQGDALFWFFYRFHSFREFLLALIGLDIAHWYRPLSNRIIPTLFQPIFGLNPYGYHWVVFALFYLNSCLLYVLLQRLTGRKFVAFAGSFWFGVHAINAYTTFDFAFAPELLYTAFYIGSVIFYLDFIRAERRRSYWASVLCMLGSLLSKEAAVTLPVMLFVFRALNEGDISIRRFLKIAWELSAHLALLAVYMGYIVFYLKVGTGDYMISFSRNIVDHFAQAIVWLCNIIGDQPLILVWILSLFSVAMLILALRLLFTGDRKWVLTGSAWFFIGLTPMLAITRQFGPYYLYLPAVGASLVFALCLDRMRLWQTRHIAPAFAMGLIFASSVMTVPGIVRADKALGFASNAAKTHITDALSARPSIPHGASLLIIDTADEEWRYHGLGALFRIFYDDPDLKVQYRSIGDITNPNVVMKVSEGRLIDVTDDFHANPDRYLSQVNESEYADSIDAAPIRLEPTEVVAGKDFYFMQIKTLSNTDIEVQYRINGGPISVLNTRLNQEGRIRFFVSNLTPKGRFDFVAYRKPGESKWTRSQATLLVR